MEKLITKTSQITTTIISNATGKNTYAIERTLSNIKGDTAIIVLLYPTVSSTRPFSEDSTLLHLTRHMAEMKLNRIVIINLFSTVCRSRLSTRGIKVDENNLRIIEKIITEKKKEHIMTIFNHVWQCKNCGYIFKRQSTKPTIPTPVFPRNCKANPNGQKFAPHVMIKVQ